MAAAKKKQAAKESAVPPLGSADILKSIEEERSYDMPSETNLKLLHEQLDEAIKREQKEKEREKSLESVSCETSQRQFGHLMIASIHPGRNVRQDFQDDFDILVESVKTYGILEPLLVMHGKKSGEFDLIAGERRLRAAKIAGLFQVPCFVYPELTDMELYDIMLTENLLRKDLNPVEEAQGLQKLIDAGMDQTKLGEKIGKSREYVANRIRLLSADPVLKEMLVSRETTPSHANVLLKFNGYPAMSKIIEYYRAANREHQKEHGSILPVKEVEGVVCDLFNSDSAKKDLKGLYGDVTDLQESTYSGTPTKCRNCDHYYWMTGGYRSARVCLDHSCFSEELKLVRQAKKEAKQTENEGKDPRMSKPKKMFCKLGEYRFNSDPVDAEIEPCMKCEHKFNVNGETYCSDPACFKRQIEINKPNYAAKSQELVDSFKRELMIRISSMDVESMESFIFRVWLHDHRSFFTDDENANLKFVFGDDAVLKDLSEYTVDEIRKMYLFKSIVKMANFSSWSFNTYEHTIKRAVGIMEEYGMKPSAGILSLNPNDRRLSKKTTKKKGIVSGPELDPTVGENTTEVSE